MSTACKDCGGTVDWKQIDGRWRCFNAGTEVDHWDACSKNRWRQTVKTGERFENEPTRTESGKVDGGSRDGYRNSVHGTKLDRVSSTVVRGKNYRPVQHQPGCEVPPWEVCPCQKPPQ